MTSKISAIPTTHAGVQFRSRLEARWSIFFDLVGWTWHYEPIDLAGYIPDFIVEHPPTPDWLSNGEPEGWAVVASQGMLRDGHVQRLVEVKPALDVVDLIQHGRKIDESGWDGHASIVGSVLHQDGSRALGATMGVFRSPDRTGDSMYDWGGSWVFANHHLAVAAWAEAGNRVQWRSPARSVRRSLHWDHTEDNGDIE